MAGIYIHIPFCKQKCSYCDFHFSTTYSSYRKRMIRALLTEIKERKNYFHGEEIETIYFGGGTPSLLTLEELQLICKVIYQFFPIKKSIEFTLEANPDDINEKQLLAWKSLGVNRLSIGIQSFFLEDLKWMNRVHTVEESIQAVELAKKHHFFLTLDLIYGLPNHTLKELSYNLEQLIKLSPEHISAYCLSVEKGTALSHFIKTGKLPKVGEDEQADQFEFLVKCLKKSGYIQYEISNFAKNGQYSVHNSNYWKRKKYLGVGPSAHSFDGKNRSWNISNNQKYMQGVLGNTSYSEEEILTPKNQFNELLLTGLRTIWGVNLNHLKSCFLPSDSFFAQLEELKLNFLLYIENDTIYLTKKGKLQADYIAAALFEE